MTRRQAPTGEQRRASIAAEIAQINLDLDRLRGSIRPATVTDEPSTNPPEGVAHQQFTDLKHP